MKAIGLVLLLAILLSTVLVFTIEAQEDGGTFQSSPLESPLPLIRIERSELIAIYQCIYWGDDGKLHYSKIWY